MIDLTPLEVRKKKGDFRKAMRGYEPQAVDDFLDLVADRLEQLVRENAALQERVGSVTTQVSDYRERERALTEALVTAQEMREQMRQQLEREAELKRREAEADADAIRNNAVQQLEREEENIRRLRARQTQFVQSYRSFLERELAELSVMTQTLELAASQEDPPAPAPRKRARRSEPAPASAAPIVSEPAPVVSEAESMPPMPPAAPVASVPRTPVAPPAPPAPPITPAASMQAEPEPIPMPLPLIEPEAASIDEPSFDAFDSFAEEPQHELIDLSKHFPPVEDVTPSYVQPEPEAPKAKPQPASEPQPPAAMDFEEFALEDEVPELELLDHIEPEVEGEKKKDDDSDGWVSTLLEGKGD